MLIDEQLPAYDVVVAEHVIVDADPATVFAVTRAMDFMTVRAPLMTAAMWVRAVPDRVRHRPTPPLPQLHLAQGVGLPGWLSLGERAGSELAFGAVGKFWQLNIEWRDVPEADFAAFAEPGWGKIACNFTFLHRGAGTLLTYECRTATTDPASRRRFARYWWLVRPFAAYIMRAALATIAAEATRSPAQLPVTA
ncbi:hypothetical protein ACFPIJ_04655 [Dactylosporangium cerinum]|uniref:SRPBCC family protein n=1 Tax=Dactylosporangium cerinum TaxID=1434730 RepID=A0ABV9VNW5_9ACTN